MKDPTQNTKNYITGKHGQEPNLEGQRPTHTHLVRHYRHFQFMYANENKSNTKTIFSHHYEISICIRRKKIIESYRSACTSWDCRDCWAPCWTARSQFLYRTPSPGKSCSSSRSPRSTVLAPSPSLLLLHLHLTSTDRRFSDLWNQRLQVQWSQNQLTTARVLRLSDQQQSCDTS